MCFGQEDWFVSFFWYSAQHVNWKSSSKKVLRHLSSCGTPWSPRTCGRIQGPVQRRSWHVQYPSDCRPCGGWFYLYASTMEDGEATVNEKLIWVDEERAMFLKTDSMISGFWNSTISWINNQYYKYNDCN